MTTTSHTAEAQIIGVFERWETALREKDLDALAECYDPGVRLFDIGSQLVGYENLRELWKNCFPYFPKPIGCERRDLHIEAGDSVAVATCLIRMSGMETDHPSARSWMRSTTSFRKVDGVWKITHEHASFAIDCGEEKPIYIFDED